MMARSELNLPILADVVMLFLIQPTGSTLYAWSTIAFAWMSARASQPIGVAPGRLENIQESKSSETR